MAKTFYGLLFTTALLVCRKSGSRVLPRHLKVKAKVGSELEEEVDAKSRAAAENVRVVIFGLLGHVHADDLVIMLELTEHSFVAGASRGRIEHDVGVLFQEKL